MRGLISSGVYLRAFVSPSVLSLAFLDKHFEGMEEGRYNLILMIDWSQIVFAAQGSKG